MNVCRVLGTLVSTAKHPAYVGHKLLLCQPLDAEGMEAGDVIIAVDHVQAGVGDRVLVMQEGGGIRLLLGAVDGKLPIRSLIVGVVDEVTVDGVAVGAGERGTGQAAPPRASGRKAAGRKGEKRTGRP